MSVSDDTVVAGAPNGGGQGSAYVYIRPAAGWSTTSNFNAELTASDGQVADAFGYAVSISRHTIAVGAYQKNGAEGAAYVFVEGSGGWATTTQTAELTDPGGQPGNEFGFSLSINGGGLVVGSSNNPSANAAFLFLKPASGWVTTSTYQVRFSVSDASIFGFSVAAAKDAIVVGSIGNNNLQGAAYVFSK